MTVRVLIVDDERLARRGLRRQLARFDDLEIVGESGDGAAAVAAIGELAPDLVFLDVQMPELDGFQVIEAVGPGRMPAVVFLTAYDEHAIRAFEADAVDYLLKPVDPDRLESAIARAVRRLESGGADLETRLDALLRRLERTRREPEARRIPVEDRGRYSFVDPAEIRWVEAAGNYVRLHTADRVHRVRSTLEAMERRLGDGYLRVSRSALVNREAVEAVEPFVKGSYVLFRQDGVKVRSARRYREALLTFLERREKGGR